ncbi:tyrosine-type recombinase/integrase [Pseudoalteromonas fenneropenaei]|uniref:Tyrosine-type recombinase/integrase n=1 Tax=Pseudoalteromonas fenneropenaei TaxID=1737459 RepID=A0ABV7CL60_9GAMM
MERKYLKRSPTGVWLFRRRVPDILKKHCKKDYFCVSLETKSITQARIKRDAISANIDLSVEEARSRRLSKERFHTIYREILGLYLEEERDPTGPDGTNTLDYIDPDDWSPIPNDETYKKAFYAATLKRVPEQYRYTITELAEAWVKQNKDKKPKKYVDSVTSYSKIFVQYLKQDDLPEAITTGTAQRFLDYLLDTGRSPSTVTHYRTKLSEVWRWGISREIFEGNNPWKNTKVEPPLKRSAPEHFRLFSPDEVKILLEQTSKERQWEYAFVTYALVRVLPFLGCRLAEFARARRDAVVTMDNRLFLQVTNGKTKNAQRIVPINRAVQPIIEEALERSKGQTYLFPEIKTDQQLNSLSSRISRITSGFEKIEGFKVSIHSFRAHFSTALEEVGCPEELAVQVAGHKRLSLTYGLYSKYQGTEKIWPYIDKLDQAEVLKPWFPNAELEKLKIDKDLLNYFEQFIAKHSTSLENVFEQYGPNGILSNTLALKSSKLRHRKLNDNSQSNVRLKLPSIGDDADPE